MKLNFQQYVAAVELFGSEENAIQDIRNGRPVRYRIRFPLQNPLPKLTQLSLNGQVHCSGPPGNVWPIVQRERATRN